MKWSKTLRLWASAVGFSSCITFVSTLFPRTTQASDAAWFTLPESVAKSTHPGMEFVGSRYLTMRDGVKIAIDVYLPEGLEKDAKVPTLMRHTRYMRSVEPRWLVRLIFGDQPYDHTGLYAKRRKWFVSHGYAWVDVDARGTGASFGHRISPLSPDEAKDGAEVVNWIVSQPWSNGAVGSLGISYPGSTAEFLLLNRHPAVKAVAPRFAVFDNYPEIAYPGGIHATKFTEDWQRANDSLDRNAPHEIAGSWVKLFIKGVSPVDEDRDRALLREALREHEKNYKVHEEALKLTFRDDMSESDPRVKGEMRPELLLAEPSDPEGSLGLFSPHNYIRELRESGAAIYGYVGWFDGAYPRSAVERFMTVRNPGSRLVIGPWNHGGGWYFEPLSGGSSGSDFDHNGELLRFFDRHLRGRDTGIDLEPPIHYFTLVEEKWKSAETWPPPSEPRSFYFAPDGSLTETPSSSTDGMDRHAVDYGVGTGPRSRWRVQTLPDKPVQYPDRREQDRRLLVYQTGSLERDTEVTGHPVLTLHVATTAADGQFFAYLEDVDEKGRVGLVTEGQLRAIHRKLSDEKPPYVIFTPYRTFKRKDAMPMVPGEVGEIVFDLLPTSYLFKKGHSIRLALAGADSSHFALPTGDPPTWTVHRTTTHPSRVVLPVVSR